mgnify:CR=1 FL=1
MNQKVNWFFDKDTKWQKEYKTLRAIIVDCGLTEELKWGCPCYTFKGNNIVLIHGFKDYCALLFHKGVLLNDTDKLLIQQTENVQSARQIRFTNMDEINELEQTIRTYVFEAYTIPTGSMEKSLLIGDFLFVSKVAYGPKSPQTPLAIPFVHHTIPILNSKSYTEILTLPYLRLPGFGSIERNDVVVFNFPAGDTVILDMQDRSYEDIVREVTYQYKRNDLQAGKTLVSDAQYDNEARNAIWKNKEMSIRPVDKRENYVKRCVAIAGDTIRIENGILYVNGTIAYIPPRMQYKYYVQTNDWLNQKRMKASFDINFADLQKVGGTPGYIIPLTIEGCEKMKKFPAVTGMEPYLKKGADPTNRVFPNNKKYKYSEDNFGPLWIPKAGVTIPISPENIAPFVRIINTYEGNTLKVTGNEVFINGKAVTEYTFKMNYYWLMGDNRHNSLDSRFWGFVPEDHVVGKASFIWLSLDQDLGLMDGKIRWDRMFTWIE